MDGYVARMKNGYVYGYSSNIFLFPDLKLGKRDVTHCQLKHRHTNYRNFIMFLN